MVTCAVLSCKRRSDNSTSQQNRVSYHKFPKDPFIKEKWRKFCNIENDSWKPTRTSVICSEHFTPDSYNKTNNRKILIEGAVPSLRHCPCLVKLENAPQKKEISTILISGSTSAAAPQVTIASSPGAFSESPRIRKLRAMLQFKNKKIRKLQEQNRYLKKKVDALKELLTNLEEKSFINEEQKMVWSKVGETEKVFIVERSEDSELPEQNILQS